MNIEKISLIIQVIVAIITVIIGPLLMLFANNYFKQREKKEDMKQAKILAQRDESMQKALKPVEEKIDHRFDKIENSLELDKRATIVSLRANMKRLRDVYKKQGYADAGDKGIWNELYARYKDMGGNHFKEYVDQWKNEVNDLPDSKN